jgi:acyl carrier protein
MLKDSIGKDILDKSNVQDVSSRLPWEHYVSSSARDRVRALLKTRGWLATDIDSLADDADLYAAGLTSRDTVTLMLTLEEVFDVELPDNFLRRRTFSSVAAIVGALTEIGVKTEAA